VTSSYARTMLWEHGDAIARMDDEGVTFDTKGAPLDLEWWCALERLPEKIDVLRQTWPESIVAEIFAEAARRTRSVPATPPPPTKVAVSPAPVRRRRKRAVEPAATAPVRSPVAGFGADALERICERLVEAARALHPAAPGTPGRLEPVERHLDPDLRTQVETRRASSGSLHVIARIQSEVQDGIGGPVAREVAVTFACEGLPAGLRLGAEWDGHALVPSISAPDELAGRASAILSAPLDASGR
jgi:hypothetical protein